jgi:protein-S-isoprenylcysteine O-methyltransferase Ste14
MHVFFRDRWRELAARLFVASLFTLLSINIIEEFVRTRHVTGLFLLASEALVVVLTIARRPARMIDRSPVAAVVTAVSVIGPPLLRPTDIPPLTPDAVTAAVSIVGLSIVIAGKMTLGRSFGIIPANRGVVSGGPYAIMRHPIYSGYLLTHIAFVAAHPSPLNVAILLVSDTALVIRALLEEKVLGADAQYRAYCGRVSWHLVPGVF